MGGEGGGVYFQLVLRNKLGLLDEQNDLEFEKMKRRGREKKIKEASGNVLICQDVVKFREEVERYPKLLLSFLPGLCYVGVNFSTTTLDLFQPKVSPWSFIFLTRIRFDSIFWHFKIWHLFNLDSRNYR